MKGKNIFRTMLSLLTTTALIKRESMVLKSSISLMRIA